MIFDFVYCGYYSQMVFKGNDVRLLFDTGAAVSMLDIYAVSRLTNHSGEAIYQGAEDWISKYHDYDMIWTGSGISDRSIKVCLKDVIVAGTKFDEFYFHLNIDNPLWMFNNDSDNLIDQYNNVAQSKSSSGVIIPPPIAILGNDVITAANFEGNAKITTLNDFNYQKYLYNVSTMYREIRTWRVYQVITPENKKQEQTRRMNSF